MSVTLLVTEETNGLVLSQNTYQLSVSDYSYSLTLSSGASPTGLSGSGSPLNIVSPTYKGQLYFDTDQYGSVWAASGVTTTSWVELVRNY